MFAAEADEALSDYERSAGRGSVDGFFGDISSR
jgi:hypothetical protein